MKSFRELSEEYKTLLIEGAKFKKVKKWISDGKGNLKKVIKKECQDSDGKKLPGFKVVDGKACKKMTPEEIKIKKKAAKKTQKTKSLHAGKIERNAEKLMRKKEAKGLINKKVKLDDE